MAKWVYTSGVSATERAAANDPKGGGRFQDIVGRYSMAVSPDPDKRRKAQLELEAFAMELRAVHGEPYALEWLKDMVLLLGIDKVIRSHDR